MSLLQINRNVCVEFEKVLSIFVKQCFALLYCWLLIEQKCSSKSFSKIVINVLTTIS
jgi:hypothetical protein